MNKHTHLKGKYTDSPFDLNECKIPHSDKGLENKVHTPFHSECQYKKGYTHICKTQISRS